MNIQQRQRICTYRHRLLLRYLIRKIEEKKIDIVLTLTQICAILDLRKKKTQSCRITSDTCAIS